MKLLIISAKEDAHNTLTKHFSHLGYDLITYYNPLKALDNLPEISPDAVIFSAEDFPRHWKPFLQVLRQNKSRESCVFILLKGDTFNADEAQKAGILSVNGIISENFDNLESLIHIEDILSRYLIHSDERGPRRFPAETYDNFEFLFNHPDNFKLITGTINDISFDGIRITPEHPEYTSEIKEGSNIPASTLRFGDYVCSVGVRVVRNNKSISFRFIDFDESDRDCFINFLDSLIYKKDLIEASV